MLTAETRTMKVVCQRILIREWAGGGDRKEARRGNAEGLIREQADGGGIEAL